MSKMKMKSKPKAPMPAVINSEENTTQFELELTWCTQSLEKSLQSKNLPPEKKANVEKAISILKSKTQPYIKKRQVMKQFFDDYRKKMADEEQIAKANNSIVFLKAPTNNNSNFIRKSLIQNDENSKNFKFNFNLNEQLDKLNINENNVDKPGSANSNAGKVNFSDNNDKEFKFNFTIT